MPRPRFCRNPACSNAFAPTPNWLVRDGTYDTLAHGEVQRYRCKRCGKGMGDQSESMHYYAKRRLDLAAILSRLRGGSSQRDIGRELRCSRTAVANAVLRLGRQAIASHATLLSELCLQPDFAFDGLLSCLCSRDYPAHITTLVERSHELLLTMTHAVTERGGKRTPLQHKRISRKRRLYRPTRGALSQSISLLVHELPRHAATASLEIHTDEHPLYPSALKRDLAMQWFASHKLLRHTRTSSTAARTTANPLFAVNYVDRMIRHRIKEHTRESIALGRCATMQMHRMWIFAWDHNVRQPARVAPPGLACRAIAAGARQTMVERLCREFTTRRRSLRGITVEHSLRQVWLAHLESPPVRWSKPQKRSGPRITHYAKLDLGFANPQGQ